MVHELALVMIKLYYADLTWGQFADKFGLKLNPKDRDLMVGDCVFEISSREVYLHVGVSQNVLVGYFKTQNFWFSYARDRGGETTISNDKLKQILTFEVKI